MSLETGNTTFECSPDEIAAYIDGEITAERESELEAHFAGCAACSLELNQQKQFLCGLNATLKQEGEMELPAGFTKLIVTNAESTVSGLRRPTERYNAVFICVALVLFVLFALGSDSGRIFDGVSTIFDQVGAVGGFFGRVIFSIFLGLAIIVRSVAAQFSFDLVTTTSLVAILTSLVIYFSRRMMDPRRV